MSVSDAQDASTLTLEQLAAETSSVGSDGEGLFSKRVALMRHSFDSDLSEIEEKAPEADLDDLHANFRRSSDQKLAALRTDQKLAEAFTAEQGSEALTFGSNDETAEIVMVFAKTEGKDSEFLGAYHVGSEYSDYESWRQQYENYAKEVPEKLSGVQKGSGCFINGLGVSGRPAPGGVFYNLTPAPEILSGLEGRLVVRWPTPRQWVRRKGDWSSGVMAELEVTKVRAPGFVMPFPGYQELNVSWDELRKIVEAPKGNPDWKKKLSAVSGVYLITDHQSGNLYVGSATGEDGIWGRWTGYVGDDPHNGNKGLRRLLEKNPERKHDFRFSLLEVMGTSTHRREVLQAESRWKRRLGSRAYGLNEN
jgi:hypothetical protein